jgi:hypothetical protein
MSRYEHLFLHSGLPLTETARRLSQALHADIREDPDGAVYVTRQGADGSTVGGEVYDNFYGPPPDPEPDEVSVLDGYETVYKVWTTTRDEAIQLAEARRIFDEVMAALGWPMLLVHELDILVAAWNHTTGLTVFPTDTTPDFRDRHLWEPYALPA